MGVGNRTGVLVLNQLPYIVIRIMLNKPKYLKLLSLNTNPFEETGVNLLPILSGFSGVEGLVRLAG